MNTRRFLFRCAAALLAALLLILPAAAEPILVDRGLDLSGSGVHWPQLDGLADADWQAEVNAKLTETAKAAEWTALLPAVMSSDQRLTADWQGWLSGGVLSCAMRREKTVGAARVLSEWSALNLDLETREPFTLWDLFSSPEHGQDVVETLLWENAAPFVSAQPERGSLFPVPETFTLSEAGVTLCYPVTQFQTLADRCGTVVLSWRELAAGGALDLSENSLAARLGVPALLAPDTARLRRDAAAGRLPALPIRIGDEMEALTGRYGIAADPDLFTSGRYVQLEDGLFRGIWLMTARAGGKQMANCQLEGIRADRFDACGLVTGETARSSWLALLGQPDAAMALSPAEREGLRLEAETCDSYLCGDYVLLLYADADGVLVSVVLRGRT